jgi:hypothetical protein
LDQIRIRNTQSRSGFSGGFARRASVTAAQQAAAVPGTMKQSTLMPPWDPVKLRGGYMVQAVPDPSSNTPPPTRNIKPSGSNHSGRNSVQVHQSRREVRPATARSNLLYQPPTRRADCRRSQFTHRVVANQSEWSWVPPSGITRADSHRHSEGVR